MNDLQDTVTYAVKHLIDIGDIRVLGQGNQDDRQWLLIKTVWGEVVYKEYWVGPGLSVDTEISTDAPLSNEALEAIGENTGLLWNDNNAEIPEPDTRSKVLAF
jgi:hypothetical protein